MGFQNLNKKGMSITSVFYAIIVAGIMLTSMGVLIATTGYHYNPSLVYDLDAFDRNQNITVTASDYQSRLSPENIEQGNFEGSTYTGSFGIINTLLTALSVVFGTNGLLSALALKFGIPMFIIQGIGVMIIVGLVFAIVGIIFRLGRQP